MYAMNRQLKSLNLFIDMLEKGHRIEFEIGEQKYLSYRNENSFMLNNIKKKQEFIFESMIELIESEVIGVPICKCWKRIKVISMY